MNLELRHDRDARWLGRERDTSCLGRELERSRERIRVRRVLEAIVLITCCKLKDLELKSCEKPRRGDPEREGDRCTIRAYIARSSSSRSQHLFVALIRLRKKRDLHNCDVCAKELVSTKLGMACSQRSLPTDRENEQAIAILKKGAYLLKYGRRGKPKFYPFRLSSDEIFLLWYCGKTEKRLKLSSVTRIIPGQRTSVFRRYPQPTKEYQSFSLIYGDRSLDLVCKDKDEAEFWITTLRALLSRNCSSSLVLHSRSRSFVPDYGGEQSSSNIRSVSSDTSCEEHAKKASGSHINTPQRLGKVFSEVLSQTAVLRALSLDELVHKPHNTSPETVENRPTNNHSPAVDTSKYTVSSALSSSSQGSTFEDLKSLCDVFVWGESIGDGLLFGCGGGAMHKSESSSSLTAETFLPKVLKSHVALDAQGISCGTNYAVLVTKQGQMYSWGEESGGRLGHGVCSYVPQPKLIDEFDGSSVELADCGEFHTCAVTSSGDLYTWGDGAHNAGLLGLGSEASHWKPVRILGQMEGINVKTISCGPWHTAFVTSEGKLFTYGDGTFGALGHGDRVSTSVPREAEALSGCRTMKIACGVWHSAAVVSVFGEAASWGKLFTWGDGEDGKLGHGDKESRLIPSCVAELDATSFQQVACGQSVTVALSASGQVYAMGVLDPGHENVVKAPSCIEGGLGKSCVQEVACGFHHIAVLNSKAEVYTWGRGSNGQLGHGDTENRRLPTLVRALKGKQVRKVVCGSNYTATICLHKPITDGAHNAGLLGLGSEASHWKPVRILGQMEGINVKTISCGPWHTAFVTSEGKLFTYGDGTFGALGHGDRVSTSVPREAEALSGCRTMKIACGVWHSAAVVSVFGEAASWGKLFTWGDGEDGKLGHGDKESRLIPSCVAELDATSFQQVACGQSVTVALSASGQVYAMGVLDPGHENVVKAPSCIEGGLGKSCVQEVACGFHHIAVLNSKAEVYTWGRGSNGQLGHGDTENRRLPTLVRALKGKQVRKVVCGSNYTATICLHKPITGTDSSRCSGCRHPFNYMRKLHNCYNCGSVFCNACTSKKSLAAAMAPKTNRPYRVCDDCYIKLEGVREYLGTPANNSARFSNASLQSSINEMDDFGTTPQRQLLRVDSFDFFRQSKIPDLKTIGETSGGSHASSSSSFNLKGIRQLSRLASFDSVNQEGKQRTKHCASKSDTSSLVRHSVTCGLPFSRRGSVELFPLSIKSSPVESVGNTSDFTADITDTELLQEGTKKPNQCLNQEISVLKAQVEELTRKTKQLEAELGTTSKKLEVAVLMQRDDAEKIKTSEEIVRSLTLQLMDATKKGVDKTRRRRSSF
ncbi:hypothetical protein DY000_02006399 [Brassica cretica]|uniref:FYVE-type domain-containing protein n=1 Tax=Brassica cretica TaxID=69181 RepID=A0ABQ7CLC4_BRACR|nr:hypothetical protein DY000_02006399 [Brassica cretica]